MKDLFKIFFMISLVIVVYIFKNNISTFILDNVIYARSNKVLTYNEYYLDYDYKYIQNTDTPDVKNYQEVLNIFYTVINSGDNNYSFNCNYTNCVNDVQNLTSKNKAISNINNFVHPFNSFSSINIDITNNGTISIKTKKAYTDEEIIFINTYISNFIASNITQNMSDYDKIKKFHDFIVNNTIYDKNISKELHTAYTLLTTGKSVCSGYSDIMSIYLNTLGIQNYKITSENHVWNLANINGVWYHIDMTWDDPVANDGKQYLLHNFLLITTEQLYNLDKVEHNFDSNVYAEAK